MSTIGLHLGGRSLSVVNLQNGRVLSSTAHEIEPPQGAVQDEAVHVEVFLNKLSRELHITKDDEIYFSLQDRDFIFRSFSIPHMRKKEIASSIEFEIEKYIPFKIEDLVWNYGFERIPHEKKLIVSFIGFNKIHFRRLIDTFSKLELKLLAVEPASLSLLRVIRSKPLYSKLNWYVLLDFSPQGSSITFFYRSLPVFSRAIFSNEESLDNEKVIEKIRFSFQYFRREYRSYDVDKLILLAGKEDHNIFSQLSEELDVEVDFVIPQEIVPVQEAGVETVKAYAAASYTNLPHRFEPLLKDISTGFLYSKKDVLYPLNIPLMGGVIAFGIAGTLLGSLFMNKDLDTYMKSLKQKEERFKQIENLSKYTSQELETILQNKKSVLKTTKEKIGTFIDVGSVFTTLASFMSKGVWLETFSIGETRQGDFKVTLSGYIYRGDSKQEADSLDEFILRIKGNAEIAGMFSNIVLVGTERTQLDKFDVAHFLIDLY